MGSSQLCSSAFSEYNTDYEMGSIKVVSNKQKPTQKYLIKSYITTSLRQQNKKSIFFNHYKAYMENNQQMMKLLRIMEEQDQHFCSTSHKIHLIFEYSPYTISEEVKERKNNLYKTYRQSLNSTIYFQYQDLCNILYSCLSSLWITKQYCKQDFPDDELQRFGNIFISPQNILIFGEGIVKIMDPFIIGFKNRYVFTHNIYYSPQKMEDFSMVDDQKCAVFELGMTMLQLSTLETLNAAYQNRQFVSAPILDQLQTARQIYSEELEQSPHFDIFNLIEKMIKPNRSERFNLQQAILYAEQMYDKQFSVPDIKRQNNCQNTAKYYVSHEKKQALNNTNYSSNEKKSSNRKNFKSFKNSIIEERNGEILSVNIGSPKVSYFCNNEHPLTQIKSKNVPKGSQKEKMTENAFFEKDTVFSAINIDYTFNEKQKNAFNNRVIKQEDDEHIFTDPQLMKTIDRQLKGIKLRKRFKTNTDQCSVILQSDEIPQNVHFKITNQVYLR